MVASAPASTPSVAERPHGAPAADAPVVRGAPVADAPSVHSAPVAESYSEPVASEPVETRRERMQPLFVAHSGPVGHYGYGTQAFGGGAAVEPKWNITDWAAVGLRADASFLFGGRFKPGGTTSVSMAVTVATLLKGELLLGSSGVRPFIGFGAGRYLLVGQSVSASVGDGNTGAGVSQSVNFFYGIAPQLGIDFGGARLGVTYNHMFGSDILLEQNVSAGIPAERVPRHYLQLELLIRAIRFDGLTKMATPSDD
ncbi:hypothetical protein [Archangium violaceum]|uniref:hypothetical protein n=1 Tax=Archangium violaceum TaxID=83451 RepID=UPI0036DDBBDE